MARPIHPERHFTGNQTVRDLVLGMADGLTVPFALAAGLTGAIETTWIIVVAGLAEVAAGAIAMGLGGYLAARSEAEHYESERTREHHEVREKPEAEVAEVMEVLESYGVKAEEARSAGGLAAAESSGLGRLHDALRARPRAPRSAARAAQRGDHRAARTRSAASSRSGRT